MQHHNQSHFSAVSPTTPCGGATVMIFATDHNRGMIKRKSYNYGRCGLPKKGHSCHVSITTTTTTTTSPIISTPTSTANSSTAPRQPYSCLRRALSFKDNVRTDFPKQEPEEDFDYPLADPESGALPATCLWEILRRLPPAELLSMARVSNSWRETSKRLWKVAEELRLRVLTRAQVGFVGSVLQKCPGLVRPLLEWKG